ncbi:glutaminase [Corynebacterium alimapuense]|uniref:Glutaminase n=1 Tax=Corynebacterium alimapuense TaxID=1576874 RepID=A0A3M8K8Y8_9CORY|nr:glutaminase [Corynebacterium alimapuense]RNE49681.1 glutaminase [Corynebacterium alimapuense]
MRTPIPDYLEKILDVVRDEDGGETAGYIPELAAADPERLAMAICTTSGHIYSAGDAEVEFTIQSISKPFVYAMALQELGEHAVGKVVGMEPSGEAFNELSLDSFDKRPVNPMINAGAIAVNQIINGEDSSVEDRVEKIRKLFSRLAGRELTIDEQVRDSELSHSDRNLSIAYMLRNYDIIHDDAHDAVTSYTSQCSILVNTRDLSVMSATLANGGVQPVTGERILTPTACRLTLAVMSSAGMYDAAGRWMSKVGIPAKSGVAGGLIGNLPGRLGIATFSPRLDPQGNSTRGVRFFERLSHDMDLHLMSSDSYDAAGVRSIARDGNRTIIRLQGMVNFLAAENILYELAGEPLGGEEIILDVSRVTEINRVGRRIVKEGLRRLREQGFWCGIYDPEGLVSNLKYADGTFAHKVESL